VRRHTIGADKRLGSFKPETTHGAWPNAAKRQPNTNLGETIIQAEVVEDRFEGRYRPHQTFDDPFEVIRIEVRAEIIRTEAHEYPPEQPPR
jgi:hypothetical protein